MFKELRPALALLALFTLLTGVIYPAAVTVAAQLLFPTEANGSLIRQGGAVRGSSLVAQPFSSPRYFWPRPSATSWNAAASGGSNLGPTNPALTRAVAERLAAAQAGSSSDSPIPVDLVTSSGSGLDPHITPAGALYQVERVAQARGLADTVVAALVQAHVEARTWGILGEPRVNVLRLNLALDSLTSAR